MAAPRRSKMIGRRRRVEDEGDDEAGPDLELDDDSVSEGTLATEDHDGHESDTSNVDEASPSSPNAKKSGNGATGHPAPAAALVGDKKPNADTDIMLNGLSISDAPNAPAQDLHFDQDESQSVTSHQDGPLIVSSASANRNAPGVAANRRRQEHEDYKKRRDEDPAFVPNRGSFFMHDHRHAGPAANGFRPFGRGRGRGGRGGIGGPFAPMNQMHHPGDPTTSSAWTHDMHEAIAEPPPRRPRQPVVDEGPPNGNGYIPTCDPSAEPINRTLSTEKHIGNAHVRVFLPMMKDASAFPGMPVKQYTKLPDHRPPLRRDKPVRISLPNRPPRYVFPAYDRSFIFIPRAMRPNQQRARGKPRGGMNPSIGGFSRRTSIYGGSYYGSMYSPSVAMSRRSSFGQDRDMMFSPAGSVIGRPPVDPTRPVVRLPPSARPDMPVDVFGSTDMMMPPGFQEPVAVEMHQQYQVGPRPDMRENQAVAIPMHQPRPQKSISMAQIEPPALAQGPPAFQQAFHQQVPVHVSNGYPPEAHIRQHSFQSQHSTGTPLPQIPERAIHAAPFQPHVYGQQPFYPQQPYQQQGYYYGQGYAAPNVAAPPNYPPPGAAAVAAGAYNTPTQPEQDAAQGAHAATANPSTVAQEANGMVYYLDASQFTNVGAYPSYPSMQSYQPSVMGMGGMVTPSPDGTYYYGQPPGQGMPYYPQ